MRLTARSNGRVLAVTMAAGLLLAGTAGPAAAATPTTGAGAGAQAGAAADEAFPSVTLLTGDRLSVATDGSNRVAMQPAPGREHVRFVSRVVAGHLQVTPVDALPLVTAGRLDQRLFDVTTLIAS